MTNTNPITELEASVFGHHIGATPLASRKHLVIFGATGGIGRQVVDQAIESGHRVTALVRPSSAPLPTHNGSVRIIEGDVGDYDVVRRTVRDADAVMCCLGAPALSRSRVRSQGTQNIVRAMTELGIQRLLCVSVLGAGETRSELPFFLRYVLVSIYLRRVMAEHETQEDIVRASNLDWTIVRPPTLTDQPRTGTYAHGFTGSFGKLALKISRADVADFMLQEFARPQYQHQSVAISYEK